MGLELTFSLSSAVSVSEVGEGEGLLALVLRSGRLVKCSIGADSGWNLGMM